MGQASAKSLGKKISENEDETELQSTACFPLSDIPDDILEEISIRVPASDLVKSCARVCKRWRDIVNSRTLWKEKCKQDYYYTDEMFKDAEDFKKLYFKNPYNSNLVRNPCAEDGFRHWCVTRNGGNHFIQESVPIGSHPVKQFAKCEYIVERQKFHVLEGYIELLSDNAFIDSLLGPVGCWVTSYHECRKEQMIDLINRGCSPRVLDNVRPDMRVSEWYAARFDCGCRYKIKIKLLDANKQVLDSYVFEDTKQAGRDWFQFSHVFTGYPPGCRFILYSHGGQDTKFWAGHYGVKITLSSLKFDFSHMAGPYEGVFQLPEQKISKSSSESESDDDDDDWDD